MTEALYRTLLELQGDGGTEGWFNQRDGSWTR